MPSYGSNDGYGRQQFSSRPSTRQTDIGRRQMQSSVMASILAEEDIVRKEEEEQPVGGRILAQQQQQQRPQPQAQQGRPAPAQQQQQRAPPQHFQADPWEAMQRQQLERTQVEQEMAQREAALARMRHEEASFQSDDDGLRRLEQQRQAVLRKMLVRTEEVEYSSSIKSRKRRFTIRSNLLNMRSGRHLNCKEISP